MSGVGSEFTVSMELDDGESNKKRKIEEAKEAESLFDLLKKRRIRPQATVLILLFKETKLRSLIRELRSFITRKVLFSKKTSWVQ